MTAEELKATQERARLYWKEVGSAAAAAHLIELSDVAESESYTDMLISLIQRDQEVDTLQLLVQVACNAQLANVATDARFRLTDVVADSLSELDLARLIGLFRGQLMEGDVRAADRALQSLLEIGFQYSEADRDFEYVREKYKDSVEAGISLWRFAARLGLVEDKILHHELDSIIRDCDQLEWPLTILVASFGSEAHAEVFERFLDRSPHYALMGLLLMARRLPALRLRAEEAYWAVSREDRFGLFYYAAQLFDSARLPLESIEHAFRELRAGGVALSTISDLKRCNLPAQLEAIATFGAHVPDLDLAQLRQAVIQSTSGVNLWQTHDSLRKECVLSLASRLGIEELRVWSKLSLREESKLSILDRQSEDCCLWAVGDFAADLSDRLRLETDENPNFVVCPEIGIAGGAETLRVLLESEGRSVRMRDSSDESLDTYCDAIAHAAMNAADVQPLVKVLTDKRLEPWRRSAAAVALRRTDLPVSDGSYTFAGDYIKDRGNGRFSRLELLIWLCDKDNAVTAEAIESLVEEDVDDGALQLARVIAGLQEDEAIAWISRSYGAERPNIWEASFSSQYGALALGKLHRDGKVKGAFCSTILKAGLTHEVGAFLRTCGEVAADDPLAEALTETVFERNSGPMSYGGLWQQLMKVCWDRATDVEARQHVAESSSKSMQAYILGLLMNGERTKQSNFVPFLMEVGREGERPISWFAAFALAELYPSECERSISQNPVASDLEIRNLLEAAVWMPQIVWDCARKLSRQAKWARVRGYADSSLTPAREQLLLADQYWPIIRDSNDRLRDWRYAQALLAIPSERVMFEALLWEPTSVLDRYFRNWLLKNLAKKLDSARKELWKDYLLPREKDSPFGIWS